MWLKVHDWAAFFCVFAIMLLATLGPIWWEKYRK